MQTLNKADREYRPEYDNANDSTDAAVAHGACYHNGPEWLWPLGYFLRAAARFKVADCAQIAAWLGRHSRYIERGAWKSLPELTNAAGRRCTFSCEAQAWSIATLLDALHDLVAD